MAVTRALGITPRIYVVGCVHGSKVSADDVRATLSAAPPGVVVLELCDARLRSLRRDMRRQAGESVPVSPGENAYYANGQTNPVEAFRASAARFGGAGPALLAFALTGVYRLQRAAGIDPGAEFKTAIRIADAGGGGVVCGDSSATDTVRNLSRVFLRPGPAARRAGASVVGLVERLVHPPDSGIRMFRVLREGRRAKELLRIVAPLFGVVTLLSAAGSSGAAGIEESILAGAGLAAGAVDAIGVGKKVVDLWVTSYLIVSSLEFFRVLIEERDRVLAGSILRAAREVEEKGEGGSVVAVLGMMRKWRGTSFGLGQLFLTFYALFSFR